MTPSIFVSIANYRDAETSKTINSIFDNARHPDRIMVGVISQVDMKTDAHCLAPRHARVKQIVTSHTESKGCCWARNRVMTELLGGEEFFLQIDSHTRFDIDWDLLALKLWSQCNDEKAFLSHYPPAYYPDGTFGPRNYNWHKVKEFMKNGIPKLNSGSLGKKDAPKAPIRNPFMAGGCFFTKADTVRKVPYDPYIYFEGEETSYAVRLFTHGYNGYTPTEPFLYHLYYNVEHGRARHFEDNNDYHEKNRTSFARIRHMLSIEQCANPLYMTEYEKYKLGSFRTLEQFEHFSGVYFKEQKLTQRAKDGDYANIK